MPDTTSKVSAIFGWREGLNSRHLLSDLGGRVMSSRITSRTYGTVGQEQQKEVTGLQFVQGLADGCCAAIKVRTPDNQGEKAFCRSRCREGEARPEA